MNEEDLKTLATQLRQPNGTAGIGIADMMNETNIKMTLHSIDQLNIIDHEVVLELGHGNCKHLPFVLEQKSGVIYYGLEISELMNKEAEQINRQYVNRQVAFFHLYDGLKIPYDDNYFDKMFTVNTIYFWDNPLLLLSEIYRVIKPNGILNITFAQKDFMQQLSFTKFGFTLYDNKKLKQLIDKTSFKIISSYTQTETVKSKTGDLVNRAFTTFSMQK
ncbi:MAG: class I SAM-dependent methyltransferase [Sphingobacterium sp.]|jgi:SAM-dependent methyltransferase|uniref:class I SAM-dependent methyltransferase n=1 Tax=Sphingobacterium sp. TaxID=341027 RepID=UPI0028273488|nr:class I SAM-dependent methyltransferase [Sphingobacterium sp.]MDR0263669.1 class I SAM-dependent methyltransferase [Sphingobacterium sp.]